MNMFENAAKTKLRFDTPRGSVSVEALYDIPLVSQQGQGFSLDQIAKDVKRELDRDQEESFVEPVSNPGRVKNELRLEILKHIIAEKLAERNALLRAAAIRERRATLEQALHARNTADMAGMSRDELLAELAKLDGKPVADAAVEDTKQSEAA